MYAGCGNVCTSVKVCAGVRVCVQVCAEVWECVCVCARGAGVRAHVRVWLCADLINNLDECEHV